MLWWHVLSGNTFFGRCTRDMQWHRSNWLVRKQFFALKLIITHNSWCGWHKCCRSRSSMLIRNIVVSEYSWSIRYSAFNNIFDGFGSTPRCFCNHRYPYAYINDLLSSHPTATSSRPRKLHFFSSVQQILYTKWFSLAVTLCQFLPQTSWFSVVPASADLDFNLLNSSVSDCFCQWYLAGLLADSNLNAMMLLPYYPFIVSKSFSLLVSTESNLI